ncbi:hypothetical protein [Thiocystis violascens]|uniref:hypothetical protein n=1 Tax=Thiocystis violascens TaxID=73141 RepID=UPI0012F6B0E0|nr:hypothetical protein [Thiocystis violascens]
MDALPGQLFIAAGAIIAALITGAFSYFNLVRSKDAKVSEFCQEWIDALRTEISIYVSRTQALTTFEDHAHSILIDNKYNIGLLREKSRIYEETQCLLRLTRPSKTKLRDKAEESF